MANLECLKLDEIESLLNDSEFLDSIENDSEINVIQLPPEKVDAVSDLEDIDEDDLGNDCVAKDVPGRIEIHFTERDLDNSADIIDEHKFEPSSRPRKRTSIDNIYGKKKPKLVSSDIHAPSTSQTNEKLLSKNF